MTNHVRVSMYNVGFGDCFLIRFPGQDREHRMLIDCGSIKRPTVDGNSVDIDDVVAQIVADVTDDGGDAHIDVVAMTHRHKDHVSGFASDIWRSVQVEQVWMPWTEDPSDAEARRLLEEMSSFAAGLQEEYRTLSALGKLNAVEAELIEHVLENTMSLSNEPAMATLHRGFAGGSQRAERVFLSRGDLANPRRPEVLPGVDVHVLAPSRDEDVITEMDPPRSESFIRAAPAAEAGRNEAEDLTKPFARWIWDPDEEPEVSYEKPSKKLLDLLTTLANSSAVMAAAALEKAVNNTSLMLAFEIGDTVLLFPGDSQWGSWRINLADPQCLDLMRRTTFYKVGHHGSHNSNPKSFINDELPGLWGAATSVTAHGRFKKIPEPELMAALGQKLELGGAGPARLVRSDELPAPDAAPSGVTVVNALRVDFEIPVS